MLGSQKALRIHCASTVLASCMSEGCLLSAPRSAWGQILEFSIACVQAGAGRPDGAVAAARAGRQSHAGHERASWPACGI